MVQVTIIMYHYVRELPLTRYPDIKGLRVSEFKRQLNFLSSKYTFVTVQDCLEAIYNDCDEFPENAALLTFDDGYTEHFQEVFPILVSHGIQGAFFPPVQAILEHKVLDVNKIHFILASSGNHGALVDQINQKIIDLKSEFGLKEPRYYYDKLDDSEHRYDTKEVIYIKRLLQRELPEKPRKQILDSLFSQHVGVNEKIFAKELYMDVNQIKCLIHNGMFVGGHGYSHKWLNAMSQEDQTVEIDKTMEFLDHLGVNMDQWVMCYPYGAYDRTLIELLKCRNCQIGLSTNVGNASLTRDNRFTLERFDTNDFPK